MWGGTGVALRPCADQMEEKVVSCTCKILANRWDVDAEQPKMYDVLDVSRALYHFPFWACHTRSISCSFVFWQMVAEKRSEHHYFNFLNCVECETLPVQGCEVFVQLHFQLDHSRCVVTEFKLMSTWHPGRIPPPRLNQYTRVSSKMLRRRGGPTVTDS